MSGQSPLSSLSRALFWTRVVMVWERLLPVFFPFVLFAALIGVAAQWGLFLLVPGYVHALILSAALLLAGIASVRGLFRFHPPSFTELNARLALDNGLAPERLLAMRHESDQPALHVGKAKAGIALADPFALRYVALVAAMMGFLILGPVPLSRVVAGFFPFGHAHTFSDMNLAEK